MLKMIVVFLMLALVIFGIGATIKSLKPRKRWLVAKRTGVALVVAIVTLAVISMIVIVF